MERFQLRLSREERLAMHARIRDRLVSERKLAVVLQPLQMFRGPPLTFQVLMGEEHTVANVVRFLHKQLFLPPERALHVYSDSEKVLRPSARLSELGQISPDGFLYLYYSDLPAFGAAR